jgi:photosystem II stability/assembly factor-like uncharacterized protein
MKKLLLLIICISPLNSFAGWVTQYSSGNVTDISFPDSLHGWATDFNTLSKILFTNNSGKIWTEKPTSVTADSNYFLRRICFANSSKGWAGGSLESFNTGSPWVGYGWLLLSTTNGFNNYTITKHGIISHYESGGVLTIMNDIDFIDTLHGWAVGDAGKILYTDNGGIDSIWEPRTSGVTNNLTCVKFVDSLNGWVGGTGVLLRTRDGGQTWANEYSGTVSKICAIDTTYAWALVNGNILKYKPYVGIEEQLDEATSRINGDQNAKIEITKNNIYLFISNTINTDIKIYDLCGRLKETIYSGVLSKGGYTFTPDVKLNGIYFVTLSAGNITTTQKLILIR